MSDIKIQPSATGTATVTLTAPVSNTARTITLPDSTGTILDSVSTLDATKLSGNLPALSAANLTSIPAGNLTGTVADARISALTSSKLTGALPAISAASLTGLTSSQMPAGSILQVVASGTFATVTITSSNTWTDTNMSVSITPSATSSKILISVCQPVRVYGTSNAVQRGAIRLLRGATVIWNTGEYKELVQSRDAGTQHGAITNILELDSPSTTSSVTYKVQAFLESGTGINIWDSTSGAKMILQEIAG
jgi:hypothetical protein